MKRDIVNPLQGLLKKAATTLPTTTGKVAQQQERIERRAGEVVILADISHSMSSIAWGGQRKIDLLREAVAAARQQRQARLVVFSREVREVESIPEPENNTNLATALDFVRQFDPGVVLVISDGEPDNDKLALAAAAKLRGVIDVLYIGPEHASTAIAFMRRLAQASGGDVVVHDLQKIGNSMTQLTRHVAGLLR